MWSIAGMEDEPPPPGIDGEAEGEEDKTPKKEVKKAKEGIIYLC